MTGPSGCSSASSWPGGSSPGSKLPSVRELAAQAGVNPNTMQRALAQLEQDGLAKADRTAGRTVTGDTGVIEAARLAYAKVNITAYFDAMADLGFTRQAAVELVREAEV